jgi:phosphatidylinositol dimannoside acyltransferase
VLLVLAAAPSPVMSKAATAYRIGARLSRMIPRRVGHRIALASGPLLARRLTLQAAQIARNQNRIAGRVLSPAESKRAVHACLGSYARYWFDALRAMSATRKETRSLIDIDGAANLHAAVAEGNGAMCVMPHLGNWDHGGAWLASEVDLTVVAEELRPRDVFDWFVELRRRSGMEVVALGPDAGPAVLRRLRSGGVVGLLCDRDIEHNGIEVTLFGEKTTMSPGPATLALRTGAALLPTASVYLPNGRIQGIIGPPIIAPRTGKLRTDIAVLTQAIADELAALIRRYPEQWHVLQPTWPTDPGYSGPLPLTVVRENPGANPAPAPRGEEPT